MKVLENGATDVEAIADLTRHQRAVNVVRWSHSGQYLASADDDANIIIWYLKTDNLPSLDENVNDREKWLVHKVDVLKIHIAANCFIKIWDLMGVMCCRYFGDIRKTFTIFVGLQMV